MINGNMAMAPTYSEKKNPLTLPINGDMAMVPTYSEKISANSPNGVSPNRLGGKLPVPFSRFVVAILFTNCDRLQLLKAALYSYYI